MSPVRTCIGCRLRDQRSALLRVVLTVAESESRPGGVASGAGVQVRPDPRCRLPGRGAWLHVSLECLDQAIRRRAFTRALRVEVPGNRLDCDLVREYLSAHTTE
ncbi:YlxR family protein [Kineosphaera limosa]|nr:YlxR family protein [Kineosphaera limosa]